MQIAPAAADHAAVAHCANHLGFVTHAYLAKLDAQPVFVHKVLHELAKVYARLGREVEDELCAIEEDLHVHKLHFEAAPCNAGFPEHARLAAKGAVFLLLRKILGRCPAHDLTENTLLDIVQILVRAGHDPAKDLSLVQGDNGNIVGTQFLGAVKIACLGKLVVGESIYGHGNSLSLMLLNAPFEAHV